MRWVTFRAIFGLKEMEKARVTWHNEGWTKITIADDWKKFKSHIVEQSSLEENGEFPLHLAMKIEGRQDGW